MRLVSWIAVGVCLMGCHSPPFAAERGGKMSAQAASVPRPAAPEGRVALQTLDSPFVKDPAFVAGGDRLGASRYITFGDLRTLYLKPFELADGLRFGAGEIPIRLAGLPPAVDSPWAPDIVVVGDTAVMLYCAGEMPHPEPPRWKTFRLRLATAPVSRFVREAEAGGPVTFDDRGVIHGDVAPFGPGDTDFGVIDPQLFVGQDERGWLSYTVVRAGAPGRPHEEFVRYRQVAPSDPGRALGPDSPLYDGLAGTEDDGVAEAQEIVTLGGQAWAIVSSRAGDIDQRLLIAPWSPEAGRLAPGSMKPFLVPGGAAWNARAVGSSGSAVIDGVPYMIYQALGEDRRFTLAWTRLAF